ncbi:MAG: hypothetical protein HY297_02580 [Thaumarchaeota archaeon]|nr:hypothetical protein [Nitrososphaerota archaeon]
MNKAVFLATVVLLATLGLSAYSYTVFLPSINHSSSLPGGSSTSTLGGPGTGTLSIYLKDSPHSNATLKYLLVNVTSVTLKYAVGEGGNASTTTTTTNTTSTSTNTTSTTTTSTNTTSSSTQGQNGTQNRFVYIVPPGVGNNVNLTSLQGDGILLGTADAPAGEVVGVILNISGAEAFWTNGNSTALKVVANGKLMVPVHFQVLSNSSTDLTIDIVPNDIHISQGNMAVLSPVIHVTVVNHGTSTSSATQSTSSETETTTTVSTNSTSTTVTTSSVNSTTTTTATS